MLRYMLYRLYRSLDGFSYDVFFVGSERPQHVIDHFLSPWCGSNANPETLKHFSEMVNHRPKSVMPSVAAGWSEPDAAEG
jgi:hypothetical protein